MKKTIWGNSIVKNEDKFIWFAIKSVVDFLDKILIFDTGSTDKTVDIIKLLQNEYPDKIIFEQKWEVNPVGLTKLRQVMLSKTKSDWLLLLDGDEVWWSDSIKKVISKIKEQDNDYYAFVNPVINLVGDIFHYQEEEAGEYNILGKKGHFNIRAINRKISGLHIENDYPLEGFYDEKNRILQSIREKLEFIDSPILHFSFLTRSTSDDKKTLHRDKVKVELGKTFPKNFMYPQVFYLNRPSEVEDPFKKMSESFRLKAALITPLKKIRRRLK